MFSLIRNHTKLLNLKSGKITSTIIEIIGNLIILFSEARGKFKELKARGFEYSKEPPKFSQNRFIEKHFMKSSRVHKDTPGHKKIEKFWSIRNKFLFQFFSPDSLEKFIKIRDNLTGSNWCGCSWCHQRIWIDRWSEENATFDAFLCDDSNSANATWAAIMEHCVENCFLHKLNAVFLLHVLFVVLANESIDEWTSGAADCATLTDHHPT